MITIVSFSGRQGGNCGRIAAFIRELTGENTEIFDFSAQTMHPCGGCRYECFQEGMACPYIDDGEYGLLDAITHSDCVYFVIPNYCDYPCANFFIFNERSQCYFQNHPERLEAYEAVPKKCVVISNSGQENFEQALAYHGNAELLVLSAKRFRRNSVAGDLMEEPQVRELLEIFCKA